MVCILNGCGTFRWWDLAGRRRLLEVSLCGYTIPGSPWWETQSHKFSLLRVLGHAFPILVDRTLRPQPWAHNLPPLGVSVNPLSGLWGQCYVTVCTEAKGNLHLDIKVLYKILELKLPEGRSHQVCKSEVESLLCGWLIVPKIHSFLEHQVQQ